LQKRQVEYISYRLTAIGYQYFGRPGAQRRA
jgi:hypothetical protein